MTQVLDSIAQVADQFDAIVLDQWGVLHDGSVPYPNALHALEILSGSPVKIGVLSNSGKRAAPNTDRIAAIGFDTSVFDCVMTSGEALWHSFATGTATARTLYPIEGATGDATRWADGLSVTMTAALTDADAILLMGLPDGTRPDAYDTQLKTALAAKLPLYCSNPDITSPRGGGAYVMSPGALADRYLKMGGTVHLYGKPHLPIFTSIQSALGCPANRILMVGDSMHHDIAGAQTAGWASMLIRGGIHAPDIDENNIAAGITALARTNNMPAPDFLLTDLR